MRCRFINFYLNVVFIRKLQLPSCITIRNGISIKHSHEFIVNNIFVGWLAVWLPEMASVCGGIVDKIMNVQKRFYQIGTLVLCNCSKVSMPRACKIYLYINIIMRINIE